VRLLKHGGKRNAYVSALPLAGPVEIGASDQGRLCADSVLQCLQVLGIEVAVRDLHIAGGDRLAPCPVHEHASAWMRTFSSADFRAFWRTSTASLETSLAIRAFRASGIFGRSPGLPD